jgi:hypothetical protein
VSGTPFERDPATVRAPNYVWLYVMVAVIVVLGPAQDAMPGYLWFLLAFMSGIVPSVLMSKLRKRSARLLATPDGVMLDGKLAMPRSNVRHALVWHENGETWVRLQGWKLLDIAVRNDEEAQTLLRALRLDAQSTTVTFELARKTTGRSAMVIVVAAVGVMFGVSVAMVLLRSALLVPTIVLAVFAVTAVIIYGRSFTATLIVGADGVRARDGLARPVFIPHDRITSIASKDRVISLTTSDGKTRHYLVGVHQTKLNRDELARQAEAIAARIRDARAAFMAEGGANVVPMLERGSQSANEWLRSLKRVGAGAGDTFRVAHLTRDRLWRIVESTSAPVAQRMAAVIALRSAGLDDEEKSRLRVIVDQCAKEDHRDRLRVAIEVDDEEQLAGALERLEQNES